MLDPWFFILLFIIVTNRHLINVIGKCVTKYLNVFQKCYIHSITIIFYSVTEYFITFMTTFIHVWDSLLKTITFILYIKLRLLETILIKLTHHPNNLYIFIISSILVLSPHKIDL